MSRSCAGRTQGVGEQLTERAADHLADESEGEMVENVAGAEGFVEPQVAVEVDVVVPMDFRKVSEGGGGRTVGIVSGPVHEIVEN